jgi:hypothetical protein
VIGFGEHGNELLGSIIGGISYLVTTNFSRKAVLVYRKGNPK